VFRLFWWRPPCLLRTVLVSLKDDHTQGIRGVLWSTRGPWLTLRQCELVTRGEPPEHVDGEIIVHTENVSFLEVP